MTKDKTVISIAAALLAVFDIGLMVVNALPKERRYYGEYYITSAGDKDHEEA